MSDHPNSRPLPGGRPWTFPPALWLGVLLLALALVPVRTAGVGVDLPYLLDVDEPLFVEPAVYMACGEILPQRMLIHPASLTVYAQAAAYRVLYEYGLATGAWSDHLGFFRGIARESAALFLIGRMQSAVVGIWVTVTLVFLLFRMGLPVWASLAGGALHAMSTLTLEMSRQARADLYLTLFTLVALHGALSILRKGQTRHYVFTGVALGLAASCKYQAVLSTVIVPIAHLLAGRLAPDEPLADEDRTVRRLTALVLGGVGLALVVHGLTWQHRWMEIVPFSTMPPSWRDGAVFLKRQLVIAGSAITLLACLLPWRNRVSRALLGILWDPRIYASGLAMVVTFVLTTPDLVIRSQLALQCIVLLCKSYHPRSSGSPGIGNIMWYLTGPLAGDLGALALVSALAGGVAALVRGGAEARLVTVFAAMSLAVVSMGRCRWVRYAVPLSPFVAAGAAGVLAYAWRRAPDRWRTPLVVGLVAAMSLSPLARLAGEVRDLSRPDARVAASEWVRATVRPRTRLVVEEHALAPFRHGLAVREVFSIADEPGVFVPGRYDLVVTSSAVRGEPALDEVYHRFATVATPVQRFSPDHGACRGPTVTVWRLRTPPRSLPNEPSGP